MSEDRLQTFCSSRGALITAREAAEQTLDHTLPYEETWLENARNVLALTEIVEEYVEHGSWRCQYRTRYKQCCCGLDERLAALGLPPGGYNDPEAA